MATLVIHKSLDRSRLERVKTVFRRPHAWLLTIPFVFFATHGYFSFQRTASTGSSLDNLSYTGRNLGFVGSIVLPGVAYGIVLWCIARNGRAIKAIAWQMKFVTVLALLTVLSATWSQEPTRSATFGLLYLLDTLFAYYLIAKFNSAELEQITMLGGLALSVLSLVMVFAFPEFGVSTTVRDGLSWNGIFDGRTTLAKCLTFFLLPAIGFERRYWTKSRFGYALLILVLIAKSHTVTALVVLSIYCFATFVLYLFKRLDRKAFLLVAGPLFGGVLPIVFSASVFLPTLFALFGRNATLSGRTAVWSAVAQSIAKRPLLGYGFYAFWLGFKGESANIIVATHWVFGYAHNGMLEIVVQLGLVGASVFLVTLIQALRNAWLCLKSGRSIDADWYVSIIVLTILYNYDEATVLWPNDLLSIFYVIACCGLAKAASKVREDRKLSFSERSGNELLVIN